MSTMQNPHPYNYGLIGMIILYYMTKWQLIVIDCDIFYRKIAWYRV